MWPVLQQLLTRGAAALKFFIAAYLLGPEQIGLFGMALVVMAIVEGASDTGLAQAIVQSRREPSRSQLGAGWTLQVTRGCLIGLAISCLANPISELFAAPSVGPLLLLLALWPVLKGLGNPGAIVSLRNRKFKRLFFTESAAALLDATMTVFLIVAFGISAPALVLGSLCGELAKLAASWTVLRTPLLISTRWRIIGRWVSYGKWIWASSLVVLLLNNFDKVVVAKFTSPADFGVYTVAFKIAQLLIAEPAVAFGQYLFPTLSRMASSGHREVIAYFCRVFRSLVVFVGAICGFLALGAWAVPDIPSSKWSGVQEILQIAAITMFQAALISSLVAFFRATGKPWLVTKAVLLQFVVLVASAWLLVPILGIFGAAGASAIAHAATLALLLINLKTSHQRLIPFDGRDQS